MGTILAMVGLAFLPPIIAYGLMRMYVPGRLAPWVVKLLAAIWLVGEFASLWFQAVLGLQHRTLLILLVLHVLVTLLTWGLFRDRVSLHWHFSTAIASPTKKVKAPGVLLFHLASKLAIAYPEQAVLLERSSEEGEADEVLLLFINARHIATFELMGMTVTKLFRQAKDTAPNGNQWPPAALMVKLTATCHYGKMAYSGR